MSFPFCGEVSKSLGCGDGFISKVLVIQEGGPEFSSSALQGSWLKALEFCVGSSSLRFL